MSLFIISLNKNNMKPIYFLFLVSFSTFGQEVAKNDSSFNKNLDEVVVTATRSERQMGALPMPVSVVSKKQIKLMVRCD